MSNEIPAPLYQLLSQIVGAARTGLHLVAIGMASALPAICASLAAKDGRSGGKEYREWCKANLSGPEFNFVTAEDLYSFRCGVLHQGRFGDLEHNVARVVFPLAGGLTFVNGKVGDAYFYSVPEFCQNMCDAAYAWYETNRGDPIVEANSKRMMQYYPQGFGQFLMPVIA